MPTPTSPNGSSNPLFNGATIDPLWWHAPRAAMVRDLPYPAPMAKQY
jgi:hypothetical protein